MSLKSEMQHHLLNQLLPFWINRSIDEKHDGFVGRIDGHDRIIEQANKGIILNTRILWTFASVFSHFPESEYFEMSYRAFNYLLDHFIDKELGGVYWMLDYRGHPINTDKNIYAQAFAIYGFATYFKTFKEEKALEMALEVYERVEEYAFDKYHGGYFEGFDRDWNKLDHSPMSYGKYKAVKTMNTHLHLLEAYTTLYKVWKDEHLKNKLHGLIDIFLTKILTDASRFNLFFDVKWNSLADIISFGHDIEGSWLLQEAAEALGDEELVNKTMQISFHMVDAVMEMGFDDDGALIYEAEGSMITNSDKHWWPQAEAIIGLVNAWQNTSDQRYLTKAEQVWHFVKTKMVDPVYGEWWSKLSKEGDPDLEADKAGPWKAPYHNGRACLEVIRRL